MAAASLVAARRLTAIRTLDREAGRLAAHLNIDPPEKPSKTIDPSNGHVKQLESVVDFIVRINDSLNVAASTVPESSPQTGPEDGPETPAETGPVEEPESDEANDTAESEEADEPKFRGKPLSFYDGKDRDALIAIKGIAETTADQILEARAKRDAQK